MADNKDIRDGRDRNRINPEEEYEVQYWSEKLGVTSEELKEAVEEVGTSAVRVEEYIRSKSNR